MNHMLDLNKMAEAMRLTRACRLTEATALLQRMLQSETMPDMTSGTAGETGRERPIIDANASTIEEMYRPLFALRHQESADGRDSRWRGQHRSAADGVRAGRFGRPAQTAGLRARIIWPGRAGSGVHAGHRAGGRKIH